MDKMQVLKRKLKEAQANVRLVEPPYKAAVAVVAECEHQIRRLEYQRIIDASGEPKLTEDDLLCGTEAAVAIYRKYNRDDLLQVGTVVTLDHFYKERSGKVFIYVTSSHVNVGGFPYELAQDMRRAYLASQKEAQS